MPKISQKMKKWKFSRNFANDWKENKFRGYKFSRAPIYKNFVGINFRERGAGINFRERPKIREIREN